MRQVHATRYVLAVVAALATAACNGDGGSGPDDDDPPDLQGIWEGTVKLGAETCDPDVFDDEEP